MKGVRQAFHDQHSVVVNDVVDSDFAESGTAAPVGVTEMAELAAAAVRARVACGRGLGPDGISLRRWLY